MILQNVRRRETQTGKSQITSVKSSVFQYELPWYSVNSYSIMAVVSISKV